MTELTLDRAMQIVAEARRKARELDCAPLAFAVLDAGGHLKAFAREDGAGILRPGIAIGKAWGALGMGLGSRELARRAAAGGAFQAFFDSLNAVSQGKVVPSPGGVLVRADQDRLLGAVGVSGDAPDRDEACAVAGIEAAGLASETG